MRTAVTIGVNKDGNEVLIHGRRKPIHEQKDEFQKLLGTATHPNGFVEVNYQESDDGHGSVRVIRFATKPVTTTVPKTKTRP